MVDSETRWAMVRRNRERPAQEPVEVLIREVTESDLPAIRDIYNYFIRNTAITFDDVPLKLDYWQNKYQMAQAFELPFLVLTRGSQLIGFAYVSPWRQRSSYLKVVENSIYLSAPATGKGYGSGLLKALLDSCKLSGIKEVIAVIADRGAQASIALHEKYGFIQQGHLAKVAVRFGKPVGSHLLSLKMSNH